MSQAPDVSQRRVGNSTVTISAINVSQWSKVATRFVKDSDHALILVSEHHLTPGKTAKMCWQCRQHGYTPIVAPAFQTEYDSHRAGTMILVANWWQSSVTPIDKQVWDALNLSPEQKARITACQVNLPGQIGIMVACIYGYNMEGLSEANRSLLHSLTILIRTVGLPTIVGGDFNLTVTELETSGFLSHSRLVRMTLDDTTCLEGQGRCLDHILASPSIQRLGQEPCVTEYSVTLPGKIEPQGFYPHLVTSCKLPRLRTAVEQKIRTPRRLHTDAQLHKDYIPVVDTGLAWNVAKQQAADSIGVNTSIWKDFLMLNPAQSLKLWSLAAELYLVQFMPLPPVKIRPHLGRGNPPVSATKPQVHKLANSRLEPYPYWSLMRTLLATIVVTGYQAKTHDRAKSLTQDLWIQYADLPYTQYSSSQYAYHIHCMEEPQALLIEARGQLDHTAKQTVTRERKQLQDRLQVDLDQHSSLGHQITKEGLPP